MRLLRGIADFLLYALNLSTDKSAGPVPIRQSGADVAIVFVHGFTGDPLQTWGHFPDLICDDAALASWDVFVYGYTTGKRIDWPSGWTGDPGPDRLSRGLLTAVSTQPLSRYKALAFIAHSMGGLVVQRALLDSRELVERTSHAFFFGTPSRGLSSARRWGFLKRQVRWMDPRRIEPLREDWDREFDTGTDSSVGRAPFELVVVDGETDDFVSASSSLSAFHDRYRRTTPGDHLSMVKPESAHDRSYRIVADCLAGLTTTQSVIDSARVAVELQEFRAAVNRFAGYAHELDRGALVQYALALEGIGRRAEAIQALRDHPHCDSDADALGTLGGRIKRRWLAGRRAADAEEALELYRRGYDLASASPADLDQMYYHSINLAFLYLLYKRDTALSEKWAQSALEACYEADAEGPGALWRRATIAEAQFILGDYEQAMSGYAAVAEVGGDPWQYRSLYHQAMRIAEAKGRRHEADRLRAIFGLPFPPL